MKKTFTILIAAIAAILMMAQPVKIWATDITVNMTGYANGSGNSYVTSNTESTISNVTFVACNYIPGNGQVRGGKTTIGTGSNANFHIYNTSEMPGAITQIVISCSADNSNYFKNNLYAATGTSSQASVSSITGLTAGTLAQDGSSFTWTFDAEDGITYFKLCSTEKFTNGSVTGCSIKITYTSSGGGGSTTYTVTYNANDGSQTPATFAHTDQAAGTYTVLPNNPESNENPSFTYTGHTFSKWNTAANGSGTDYDPEDNFNLSAATTLFAKWTIKKYHVALSSIENVTLTATYGTNSTIEEGDNPEIDYNTEITLNANGLANGKTFVWDVYKTGETDTKVTVTNNKFNVPDFDVTISGEIVDLDYNNTYTSNVTLSTSGGASASSCKVEISNVEYDGIKAGTSSAYGAWQVTVPANTTKLHLHFAAWNGETVTLSVTPSGYSSNISLTANSGVSGSSTTYTWGSGNEDKDPSSSNHYKVITFDEPLENNVNLTFTASNSETGKRFVVWGVNAEASTDPYITAEDVDIDDDATSGSITYTVHNIPSPAGTLTAAVKPGGDWLTLGDVSTNVPFTCSANPNAVERTATVTLTYTYGDSETTTLDVTVTQAPKVVTYTYTLATSIESGRHYILVGYEDATPYAMGAQNGNVRNAIDITDEGNDVVSFTSDKGVREMVINGPEIITKNDKPVEVYTLYDAAASGYVYASSDGSNNIGTRTYNTDANSQWKIVYEEENGNFIVTAQGSNSRNILKYNYNSGNTRFSCYGSGTSLTTLLYLYVKNEAAPQYDFYKDITAHTEATGLGNTDGWYFIASPVNSNNMTPSSVTNMIAETAADYDLYRLSGNTLENYKNSNHTTGFVIANGAGYLYSNASNTTLKFSGSSVKTYSTSDNTVSPINSGWNLIGNPYTFPVKVSKAFSELNNGSAVSSKDANSVINPGAGIIVYGTDDVTFTKYVPEEQSSGPSNINIMLAQQVVSRDGSSTTSVNIDNAVVSFDSNSRLPKFTMLEGNAKLFIPQNDEDYAIAFSDRQGDIPLNFKTKEVGTFTISFAGEEMDLNGIYLIDILAQEEIDLSVNPSYTFIGSPADRSARFKIVFRNVNGDNTSDIFAYQSDNDIVVSGEGELQIFDVMGRMVSTHYISGVETINVKTQGVYIMKLNDKTQKVVVR